MSNVSELLAEQAARTPDATAVVLNDRELTYRQLDEEANRLGRHLAGLGVGPDTVVALRLERSLDMIVGLFAILRAGGAYLPLDPATPAERLALILGSARPRLVLTQESLVGGVGGYEGPVVCVDRDREAIADCSAQPFDSGVSPGNLAYVIYSSGSTGVPKGIMIDHRALRDRALAKTAIYGFTPEDRVLQFTALSFDAAAAEIYPTLLAGAALVVHPAPNWTSPPELIADCERLGITGVMLPPVYLQLLVDTLSATGRTVPWLRCFITGGESIPVERLAAWARLVPHRPRFVYAYGPTETTIAATLYLPSMDPAEIENLAKVPIGTPLPNTGVHLLDDDLLPVPDGQVGELWITGIGLARGYVSDPALTAVMFLPCPFGDRPGERMYRTGDLARRGEQGELEFVGRRDAQLKIRGYRVDPGDVEAALTEHPGVGPAVVVAHEGRLAAYCVPAPGARPTPAELRRFVGGRLPDYLVPSYVTLMDALPLTSGGKVDLRALPAPRDEESAGSAGPRAESPIELLLHGIWCDLLHRDRMGTDEDFFAVGGDSLLASRMVARVRESLGVEVPLRAVFEAPTIAALTTEITRLSVAQEPGDDLLELIADLENTSDDAAVGHLADREPRP
ncbi:amino acid adenylation domain-containing protein [Streptomyces sp. NPDC058683]|uniref:non-ribosomal peptide synthetase n=1 Tax=Streptomyces sp. NPDC058683 TaxID=3346597 RepID=UPI00365D46BD